MRKVNEGGSQVPYWEAGAAYEPYRNGYLVAEFARMMHRGQSGG